MKKFVSLVMILTISFCGLMGCHPLEVNADVTDNNTSMSSAICPHQWENATCTEPATCVLCGETAGTAVGHQWAAATYESPKTCVMCGETEGTKEARRCTICDSKVERKDTPYCTTHDCGIGNCAYPAKNIGSHWSAYCQYHSCQEPMCLNKPIGGITGYCSGHQAGG